MLNSEKASVPYFEHESAMYRAEKSKKRMMVALIFCLAVAVLAICALIYNNHMWMEYAKTITVAG